MAKIKLDSEEFLRVAVTHMLREYGVDYDYVVKNPKINGVLWCQYYWDTKETKEEFLSWLRNYLKVNVNYKPHSIEDVVNSIDTMWGLKVYKNDIKK
jgi:hypothetical protein